MWFPYQLWMERLALPIITFKLLLLQVRKRAAEVRGLPCFSLPTPPLWLIIDYVCAMSSGSNPVVSFFFFWSKIKRNGNRKKEKKIKEIDYYVLLYLFSLCSSSSSMLRTEILIFLLFFFLERKKISANWIEKKNVEMKMLRHGLFWGQTAVSFPIRSKLKKKKK